eukprot:5581942-Prorocentrum_lima.AAC.1
MTSSLVGSEMCIRDSKRVGAEAAASTSEANDKRPRSSASSDNPRPHQPVSYTHLTLPTICSV